MYCIEQRALRAIIIRKFYHNLIFKRGKNMNCGKEKRPFSTMNKSTSNSNLQFLIFTRVDRIDWCSGSIYLSDNITSCGLNVRHFVREN